MKGADVRGFQFLSFATNDPDALARNDAELAALLASGRALPHIGAVHPLDEVVAALREVGDGRAVGKVVLDLG